MRANSALVAGTVGGLTHDDTRGMLKFSVRPTPLKPSRCCGWKKRVKLSHY